MQYTRRLQSAEASWQTAGGDQHPSAICASPVTVHLLPLLVHRTIPGSVVFVQYPDMIVTVICLL